MLVLDVDGILTDTSVWMDANGEWRRAFSIRDGSGIVRLVDQGYKLAVITGSKSEDIRARVKVLGIHFLFEGYKEKLPALTELEKQSGIKAAEMAYMGDDYFDVPVLEKVGFAATVPDAMDEVFEVVDYVTKRPAGRGAVREVCDFIYKYGAFAQGEKT